MKLPSQTGESRIQSRSLMSAGTGYSINSASTGYIINSASTGYSINAAFLQVPDQRCVTGRALPDLEEELLGVGVKLFARVLAREASPSDPWESELPVRLVFPVLTPVWTRLRLTASIPGFWAAEESELAARLILPLCAGILFRSDSLEPVLVKNEWLKVPPLYPESRLEVLQGRAKTVSKRETLGL
jgi:hypothetical protein